MPKIEDVVEVDEGVLDTTQVQGLLDLAHRLGIVTNETKIERDELLKDIKRQVLKT